MAIPQCIKITTPEAIQIHGFGDSSTKAYTAIVYLKTLNAPIKVHLLASKTRITFITPITLPRLELCAALQLSELVSVIKETLPFIVKDTFLWTDSTIAFCWIQINHLKTINLYYIEPVKFEH